MQIEVEQLTEEPWEFAVGLREADENLGDYLVSMSEEEYTAYGRGAEPREVVRATFRFLLDREDPEMIVDRFGLNDILEYYPDYPKQVENYF
jgi:hypothetical protein